MIEPYFLKLLNVSGFVERFHDVLQNCETHEQAYDLVEKQHIEHFNKRRYTDYESFRSAKSHYFIRKRKQKQNGKTNLDN